jgi:signal transduction histidine kinase
MKSHGRRQLILFLAALMLPSAVIAALGWRIIAQDREIAARRVADDLARTKDEIYRAVLARLNQIKLQLIAETAEDGVPPASHDSIVVFTAGLIGDQLLFPWDVDTGAERFRQRIGEDGFAGKIQEGRRVELVHGKHEEAAAMYAAAVQIATNDSQRVLARSLLARALARTGATSKSRALDLDLLKLPSDVVDEEGVPFAYHSAGRLAQGKDGREVFARLSQDLTDDARRPLSPTRAYRLKDILQTLQKAGEPAVARDAQAGLDRLSTTLAWFEQAESLRARFSTLGVTPSDWLCLDQTEPWCIGLTESKPAVAIAVAARDVVRAESDRIATRTGVVADNSTGSTGEPLGELLRGLKVTLRPVANAPGAALFDVRAWFYALSLLLVVGLSCLGGYLLWRDTRREVRMAELRSQFVSSVSHELKTPLTAIRMFAETLQIRQATDPRVHSEYLETIVNESERLTRLLNNVLDFSRIERGEKTYHKKPTRLADVVNAAARALQYPLAQQGFNLRVAIDEDVPAVDVDRDAIEQAILNLLTNAMKYSGQSREIELRLCRQNGSAVVQVADRGIGIPADERKRIFERFYRVRLPEHQAVAGTGLGLALVAHIANAHGGGVDVQSRPGEGSVFSIHLPVHAHTVS